MFPTPEVLHTATHVGGVYRENAARILWATVVHADTSRRNSAGVMLWSLAVSVWLVAACRAASWDGCPDKDFTPVGDSLCVAVTSPGPHQEAVDTCYNKSDRFWSTLLQLDRVDPQLYSQVLQTLLDKDVLQVWVEAKQVYQHGDFVYIFPGNQLYNTVINKTLSEDVEYGDSNGSCLSFRPYTRTLYPRDCNSTTAKRNLRAVCLAPRFRVSTGPLVCPEPFITAPSIREPVCFTLKYVQNSSLTWRGVDKACVGKGSEPAIDSFIVLSFRSPDNPWRYLKNQCPYGVMRGLDSGTGQPVYMWTNGTQAGVFEEGAVKVEQASLDQLGASGLDAGVGNVGDLHHCVVCRAPRPPSTNPSLKLTFDRGNDKLKLTIYNRKQLKPETLCFTDAVSYLPSYVEIHVETSMEYNVNITGDGFYWCVAQDALTQRPITSNKLLIETPDPDTKRTLAVLADVDVKPGYNIQVILKDTLALARFLFNDVDFEEGMLKIKRIYFNPQRVLLHAVVPILYGKVTQVVNAGGYVLQVAYVRQVRGCPEEDATDEHGNVNHWVPASTGKTVEIGTEDCVEAVRTCTGEFPTGSYWITPPAESLRKPWCIPVGNSSADSTVQVVADQVRHIVLPTLHNVDLNRVINLVNQALEVNTVVLLEHDRNLVQVLQYLESVLLRIELSFNVKQNYAVRAKVASIISDFAYNLHVTEGVVFTNPHFLLNDSVANSSFTLLSSELDVQTILKYYTHVDVAVILSKNLTEHEKLRVSYSIFADDNAFKLISLRNRRAGVVLNSRVVNVGLSSVSRRPVELAENEYVDFLLRAFVADSARKLCAWWSFGVGTSGEWLTNGCTLLPSPIDGLDICRCSHLSYVAQIITSDTYVIWDVTHIRYLRIIRIVGCSVSYIGLLGIFITAIVLKDWGVVPGNKVLQHLCLIVSINSILLLFSDSGFDSTTITSQSICMSALLHYTVLVMLGWVFVLAHIQRLYLNDVLQTENSFLRLTVCTWAIPIVPTLVLVYLDHDLYSAVNAVGICYPGGLAFYIVIVFPVAAVVLAILCTLSVTLHYILHLGRSKSEHNVYERMIVLTPIFFAIVIINFIFSVMSDSIIFAYVFCITGSFLGVFLFVLFVLCVPNTRRLWAATLRCDLCCGKEVSPAHETEIIMPRFEVEEGYN